MTAEALRWWLVIQGAGLVTLPLTLLLFRNLPGRGYAFAKPVGLLLGGYLFWLALSAHVLPNRPGTIAWVYLVLLPISLLLLKVRRDEVMDAIRERAGLIIATEVVFTLAFAIGVYLKSFIPEIAQTEKPMDFMMLNAADRSRFYPPADPWFSGLGVSYYYFGYVLQSMVGKMAAVQTPVGFNLALVGTAAMAVTAAFGLGYELASIGRAAFKTALKVGVAAVLLVAVIGNLENVIELSVANGDVIPRSAVEWVDIANVDAAQESDACLVPTCIVKRPTDTSSFWWWWRSTRISPDAGSITEFPFFSFLLGDLHPHVMALPFVLTALALGLSFWRMTEGLSLDTWKRRPWLLAVSALLLGGLGFLNTWDLPTFGFVVALLVGLRCWLDAGEPRLAAKNAAGFLLPLLAVAVLLYVPFYASFSSQASGLAAVKDGATRPIYSLLFWGPLMASALPLPALLLLRDRAAVSKERLLQVAAVPILLLTFWSLLLVVGGGFDSLSSAIEARGWNWLTATFYATALCACLLALWRVVESDEAEQDPALTPVLVMMSTALLLILGAELFYIKDVFGTRLNTVFKLSYQAWPLLGVSGAYSLYLLATGALDRAPAGERGSTLRRRVWLAPAAVLITIALLYPINATLSRTNGLSKPGRTLDGLLYARGLNPEEYAGADWLRSRADPGNVVALAIGGQYSPASMVSAWTGIPTVLGWPGHEVQWGRSGDEVTQRKDDIDEAYSTESLADALTILRKYDVTYVYIGNVEEATYPPAGLSKFVDGLPIVFRSGNTTIFRVPVEAPPPVVQKGP